MTEMTASPLFPKDIETFVRRVFGYLDGQVAIRMFAESGTPDKAPKIVFCKGSDAVARLTALAPSAATDGYGVFVVPATVREGKSAKVEDIEQSSVLLIDLDSGDIDAKAAHLEAGLGPASMVISSGGQTAEGMDKLHLYWCLTEAATGEDLLHLSRLRSEIAGKAGGDNSFARLHQPVRVPGTIHGKNGQQAIARIRTQTDLEYDLGDLKEAVGQMSSLGSAEGEPRPPKVGATVTARRLATRTIRAGAMDEVTRFDALSKVIGHWIRNVRQRRCRIDAAWEAVQEHNAAMISPPWGDTRLRRSFEAILKCDINDHGPMPDPDDLEGVPPPHLSEDALAAVFARESGHDWRHVSAWGSWLEWSGRHWRKDETIRIFNQARHICRTEAQTTDEKGEKKKVASARTMAAVLKIAATDPRIAVRVGQLDRHPFLLNTPDGIVDLETGAVDVHDRNLLLTQVTASNTADDCPLWHNFLERITGEDPELQDYLARICGYCLTGSNSEQAFFFLYGSGANGKSVFLSTLGAVLGDYARTAPFETFMAAGPERSSSDLAGLRGARLVIVGETEQGRAWAETRLKAITGGDTISARFLYKDFFEFRPEFKLIIAGNHRPSLLGVGEAMRRRLHLVPFEVTIPPEDRDPALATKLMAERDGILGWMIKGCLEWQTIGLAPPTRVSAATGAYFDDEDHVGRWIVECCETGPQLQATFQELYGSWMAWTASNGHQQSSSKWLGERLNELGYKSVQVQRQRGRRGICPVVTPSEPQ